MLPSRTTILIVGAGPTELAAAVALFHHGCPDIVIVDAVERDSRPQSSRALVIHAATLEALESIGCSEPLTSIGIKADFSGLTGHTYFLLVSQYSTERTLENKLEGLGVKVHRPYNLVGLDDGGEEGLVATFESGESIKASYVVSADGARSAVRQLAKVGYADPDGEIIDEDKQMQIASRKSLAHLLTLRRSNSSNKEWTNFDPNSCTMRMPRTESR